MVLFFLHDSAVGFSLFELKSVDETSIKLKQVQQQISSYESFSQLMRLKAFLPFNAESALESSLKVGLGTLTETLQNFIETNIQKTKKKGIVEIATLDNKLAQEISSKMGLECKTSDVVLELFRGIRAHFPQYLKEQDFKDDDLVRAQLGLAHSWSRNRISFDINRQDKPIIQSIAVLEQLDKDLNTFSMRIKEWYGWHFPELAKIVNDNEIYIQLVNTFGDKSNLKDERLPEIEEVVKEGELAQQVLNASKQSMGQEFSELDMSSIQELTQRVLKQFEFRRDIAQYLQNKMMGVAPNLTTLIGETVGAKLISHSGGLSNLIKYPASTVQILGAEKALFRALKTKGNTPKYGILYHSAYIGKASGKDKGKLSRYVANKCSLAARLDHFLVNPTNRFGEKMKQQVEDRLKFLATGGETEKNLDVMEQVLNELKEENLYSEKPEKKLKKKKKQNPVQQQDLEDEQMQEEQVVITKKKKKKVVDEE